MSEKKNSGLSRRDFLKVIGVAGGTAAVTGACSGDPVEQIIPYVIPPESYVPAVPKFYASTCRECPSGCGIVVKNRDGRAIKVEGNPASPTNEGSTCARGQASLQGLYNPDRIRSPLGKKKNRKNLVPIGWDEGIDTLSEKINRLVSSGRGSSIVYLSNNISGTLDNLVDRWVQAIGGRRYTYESFSYEPIRQANRICFDADEIPTYRIEKADYVLSFGADFLETWLSPTYFAKGFSKLKTYKNGRMGKVVQVEPRASVTATSADLWLAVKPGTEVFLALGIANVIVSRGWNREKSSVVKKLISGYTAEKVSKLTDISVETINQVASDFSRNRSIAIGGGVANSGTNATETMVAINILNYLAGNIGKTVDFSDTLSISDVSTFKDITGLFKDMEAGKVELLIVQGTNPAFTLPRSFNAVRALGKAGYIVSLSSFMDETTEMASLVLPDHHSLESWGDYYFNESYLGMIQPVMHPVFNTKSVGDLIIELSGKVDVTKGLFEESSYYDYLRSSWKNADAIKDLFEKPNDRSISWSALKEKLSKAKEIIFWIAKDHGDVIARECAFLLAGVIATWFIGGPFPWLARFLNWILRFFGFHEFYKRAVPLDGVLDKFKPFLDKHSQRYQDRFLVELIYRLVPFIKGPQEEQERVLDEVIEKLGPLVERDKSDVPKAGSDFEAFWRQALKEGGIKLDLSRRKRNVSISSDLKSFKVSKSYMKGDGEFYFVTYPSYRYYDGSGANKPWLQELPEALSTSVWDSYVEVHPDVAEKLGVRDGSYLNIKSPYGEFKVQAFVYEGIRSDTVAVPMGQGHTSYGRYARDRGVNPLDLLPDVMDKASGGFAFLSTKVSVSSARDHSLLVRTQYTKTQHDRDVAKAMTISELKKGGHHHDHHEEPDFYPPRKYAKHRWAMNIDLNKCTGCGACVTACYAENNIPFVGKDQVAKRRDMAWIRIERYFDKDESGKLDVRFLPMLCQHCGNAPCEPVCPVYATYHSPEGLNGMVYNRCVGTRYCANNCTYKVRKFNWYTYKFPEPLNWQLNPDVTVRTKGVMEKCTFCVQRIKFGEDIAKDGDGVVRDGDILTACQQACPTDAIVFGDLKDKTSKVSKLEKDKRGYKVFEVINTKPGITYLKKLKWDNV